MKKNTLLILLAFYISSCDRKPPPKKFGGKVNITARIVNPRDSIGINDTLIIKFEASDTLVYNGNKVKISYSDKDLAYCDLMMWKIDKAGPNGFGVPLDGVFFATVGYKSTKNVINFQNNGTSMKAEYCFIPKSKGVYFLNQVLPGQLSANNGQYLLDTYWDYGNINRNHQMLIDSMVGLDPTFSQYLQEEINAGMEVYGFKVN